MDGDVEWPDLTNLAITGEKKTMSALPWLKGAYIAPTGKAARVLAAQKAHLDKVFVGVDPAGPDGSMSVVTMVQSKFGDMNIWASDAFPDDKLTAIDTKMMLEQMKKALDFKMDRQMRDVFSGNFHRQYSPMGNPAYFRSDDRRGVDAIRYQQGAITERVSEHLRSFNEHRPPRLKMPAIATRGGPSGREGRTGEMLTNFLWGPHGEWTGFVKPQAFRGLSPDRALRGKVYARDFVSFDRSIFTIHFYDGYGEYINRGEVESYIRHYSDRSNNGPRTVEAFLEKTGVYPVFVFETYRDVINWGEWLAGSHEHSSMPRSEDEMKALDIFYDLNLGGEVLNNWLSAMTSGQYGFGYGLMRDDRDRYDAFGVLADLNAVEWEYDEDEGGWKIGDYGAHGASDVFAPTEAHLRQWLLLEPHVRLGPFMKWMDKLGDEAKDFRMVSDTLRTASGLAGEHSKTYRSLIQAARSRHSDFRSIADYSFDKGGADQVIYHHRDPFGDGRWT